MRWRRQRGNPDISPTTIVSQPQGLRRDVVARQLVVGDYLGTTCPEPGDRRYICARRYVLFPLARRIIAISHVPARPVFPGPDSTASPTPHSGGYARWSAMFVEASREAGLHDPPLSVTQWHGLTNRQPVAHFLDLAAQLADSKDTTVSSHAHKAVLHFAVGVREIAAHSGLTRESMAEIEGSAALVRAATQLVLVSPAAAAYMLG